MLRQLLHPLKTFSREFCAFFLCDVHTFQHPAQVGEYGFLDFAEQVFREKVPAVLAAGDADLVILPITYHYQERIQFLADGGVHECYPSIRFVSMSSLWFLLCDVMRRTNLFKMVPCDFSIISKRFSTDLIRICVPAQAPPPANAAVTTPMMICSTMFLLPQNGFLLI